MKTTILSTFAGLAIVLLAAGCINTVSGTKTPAMSFGSDRFEGRYERSPDQVYKASVAVLNHIGVLLTEFIPHDSTNNVRAIYGKVNQRKVWIRVEPVDAKITAVTVQARTRAGFRDPDLVHEIEKEIALQLQAQPAM
jgi:hypothetical protein